MKKPFRVRNFRTRDSVAALEIREPSILSRCFLLRRHRSANGLDLVRQKGIKDHRGRWSILSPFGNFKGKPTQGSEADSPEKHRRQINASPSLI
jgi:hypothetical protein